MRTENSRILWVISLLFFFFELTLTAAAATSQVQEVRIFLPKPKPRFEINLPVPEPLIQIVDQVQGDITPSLCPAPARNEPACSINSLDASQLSNEFHLSWRCDGSLRPCSILANGQPAGSVRGTGSARLTLPGINATYELRDRNNRSCGATIVYGYRGASPSPVVAAASSITYTQSAYRWCESGWAPDPTCDHTSVAQNTPETWETGGLGGGTTASTRLVISVRVSGAGLSASGQSFKLQAGIKGATCAAATFSDVNAVSGVVRFKNESGISDGSAMLASSGNPTDGAATMRTQTFHESATAFTNSISAIGAGENGMWDFAIAFFEPSSDTYCFRIVKSDGTTLDSYTVYPEEILTNT